MRRPTDVEWEHLRKALSCLLSASDVASAATLHSALLPPEAAPIVAERARKRASTAQRRADQAWFDLLDQARELRSEGVL